MVLSDTELAVSFRLYALCALSGAWGGLAVKALHY
jgi:hypothetical protein